MKVVWTDEAVGQLDAIVTNIEALDPAAAARLDERLVELADSLAEFPIGAVTPAMGSAR